MKCRVSVDALNWCGTGGWTVPGLIVDLVTEARGVDNGQGDAGALLVQLKLCCGGLG